MAELAPLKMERAVFHHGRVQPQAAGPEGTDAVSFHCRHQPRSARQARLATRSPRVGNSAGSFWR